MRHVLQARSTARNDATFAVCADRVPDPASDGGDADPNRSFVDGFRAWKFALFAVLTFTIPYWLVAKFLGPELPSLPGGIIGLMIVVPAARAGLFLPSDQFDCPRAGSNLRL